MRDKVSEIYLFVLPIFGDYMATALQLISKDYQGISVQFNSNGYLNATAVAKEFGREARHWLDTDRTKAHIGAVSKRLNRANPRFKIDDMVIIKQGRPIAGGGTWIHPKLAVDFARWLDPDFGAWCDEQIELILSGAQPTAIVIPESSNGFDFLYSLLDKVKHDSQRLDRIDGVVSILNGEVGDIKEKQEEITNKSDDHEDRIKKLEETRVKIKGDVKERHRNAVKALGGLCPCCHKVKIVNEDGNALRGKDKKSILEYDHHTKSVTAGFHNTWPVCADCNWKLHINDAFKHEKYCKFQAYQDFAKDYAPEPVSNVLPLFPDLERV